MLCQYYANRAEAVAKLGTNASGWSVVFEAAARSGAASASYGQTAAARLCVLERSFKQWGVMALLDSSQQPGGKARLLRKSVGDLAGINQPRFNFTAEHYKKSSAFEDVGGSLTDYLSELALARSATPPGSSTASYRSAHWLRCLPPHATSLRSRCPPTSSNSWFRTSLQNGDTRQ